MRAKPLYKERYPGLHPFDKGQSTIFFGRDKETKDLFYKICLEKIVVLFGKSGLGKSSLLNAGVSPLLEKNGYLPIRIRFTSGTQASTNPGSENLLINDFKQEIKGDNYKDNILYDKNEPKIWELIKSVKFNELVDPIINPELWNFLETKKGGREEGRNTEKDFKVTPVFIFDQFEEFFNHPVLHQQEFMSQLSEALHEETPHRILEWLTSKEPEDRTKEEVEWHKQPLVKVVFALRSDKLALMQSVVNHIATVLGNRFELKALIPVQAEQAITGPAAKTDLGSEYIPAFSFEKNTLDEIVHELSGESNEIESSQLQIICNHIEQKVISQGGGNSFIVDKNIIEPKVDFPLIIENFYETQLSKIEEPENREIARKLIEDDLVIDGQRDSISKIKLNNTLHISDDLIEELVFARLIREEATSRGIVYELSHDTLIAPVEKSKNRRLQSEKDKKREEEKILLAQEATKKDEELKERYKQLIKEIQLKEEAQLQKEEVQQQKEEVERLSRKVKSRGRWIIMLILILLLPLVIILISTLRNARGHLEKTRNQLKNESLDDALDVLSITEDSTTNYDPEKNNDSIKATVLTLIDNADSISQYTDDKKNPVIDSLIDTYYKKDFKKENIDYKILSTNEKIETLKKILPKYEQYKLKPEYDNKPVRLERVKSFKE